MPLSCRIAVHLYPFTLPVFFLYHMSLSHVASPGLRRWDCGFEAERNSCAYWYSKPQVQWMLGWLCVCVYMSLREDEGRFLRGCVWVADKNRNVHWTPPPYVALCFLSFGCLFCLIQWGVDSSSRIVCPYIIWSWHFELLLLRNLSVFCKSWFSNSCNQICKIIKHGENIQTPNIPEAGNEPLTLAVRGHSANH